MDLKDILTLSGEIITLLTMIISGIIYLSKIIRGQKCILRSEMLKIYYKYQDTQAIPQYAYENFILLYDAYKNLHGNSFIDKVYDEIKKWKVLKPVIVDQEVK